VQIASHRHYTDVFWSSRRLRYVSRLAAVNDARDDLKDTESRHQREDGA